MLLLAIIDVLAAIPTYRIYGRHAIVERDVVYEGDWLLAGS